MNNTTIASMIVSKVLTRIAAVAPRARAQNIAIDLAENSVPMHYPAANVYCEKIINNQVEKFRSFSGRVLAVVELRHSQDRVEGLQMALENAAGAVADAINATRGDWADGMFYSGGYEVSFGAVKHGGKNFIQVAKVTFEIGVSRN